MPHVTIEYSSNLAQWTSMPDLVRALHNAVLDTGVFELSAIRTRAEPRDLYCVADEHPDNAFVHVTLRMGQGRDEPTRRRVGEALMTTLSGTLAPVMADKPMALSVDIQEIESMMFRKNGLHDKFGGKGPGA